MRLKKVSVYAASRVSQLPIDEYNEGVRRG